jgi:hypothetical protein
MAGLAFCAAQNEMHRRRRRTDVRVVAFTKQAPQFIMKGTKYESLSDSKAALNPVL